MLAQRRLGGGRIHHAMRTIAQCKLAFDMMCERALSRESHGKIIGEHQMVQEKIADSYAQIRMLRLLVLETAWKIDNTSTQECRTDIATVKFTMAKVLRDVSFNALHIMGSLGTTDLTPLQAMYAAAPTMGIADGVDEVHKATVARNVLKGYRPHEGYWPTEYIPAKREAAWATVPAPVRRGPRAPGPRRGLPGVPGQAALIGALRAPPETGEGPRAALGRQDDNENHSRPCPEGATSRRGNGADASRWIHPLRTGAATAYIPPMRRDELRDMLIEVGLDLLIDEGLARGTERLTFKRVFDRAAEERGVRVTNASVIGRIWADMADYQADVLAAALENIDQAGVEDTIRAAGRGAGRRRSRQSWTGRRAATTEVIRVACAAHIETIVRSRTAEPRHRPAGPRRCRGCRRTTGRRPRTSVRRAYEVYCIRWDFVLERAFEMPRGPHAARPHDPAAVDAGHLAGRGIRHLGPRGPDDDPAHPAPDGTARARSRSGRSSPSASRRWCGSSPSWTRAPTWPRIRVASAGNPE